MRSTTPDNSARADLFRPSLKSELFIGEARGANETLASTWVVASVPDKFTFGRNRGFVSYGV